MPKLYQEAEIVRHVTAVMFPLSVRPNPSMEWIHVSLFQFSGCEQLWIGPELVSE